MEYFESSPEDGPISYLCDILSERDQTIDAVSGYGAETYILYIIIHGVE